VVGAVTVNQQLHMTGSWLNSWARFGLMVSTVMLSHGSKIAPCDQESGVRALGVARA
jgi:hypothetical protein